MSPRPMSLAFAAPAALLAALALASPSPAAGKTAAPVPAPGPSPAQREANILARQDLHGNEAEFLQEVYILLALADRDYHGHKGNAMHELKEAWKIFDHNIEHHGTAAQKAQAEADADLTARIKKAADRLPAHHEGQAFSDAQLRMAGAALERIAPVLAAHNQPHALGHVKNAYKEIKIALGIR